MLRYSLEYLDQHAFALATTGGRDYDFSELGRRKRFAALLEEQVTGFSAAQYRRAVLSLWRLRLLARRFYSDPRVPSRAEALDRLKRRCPGFAPRQYEAALGFAAGELGRKVYRGFR